MDATKNFELFNKRKIEKFKRKEVFEPLANDILAIDDNGDYVKIEGSVEIEKIVDIIKDEKEVAKLEAAISGYPLNTDIQTKEVKRGDIIWVTAMLKKNSTASLFTNHYCVLKCRVSDIYQNLSILKNVIK